MSEWVEISFCVSVTVHYYATQRTIVLLLLMYYVLSCKGILCVMYKLVVERFLVTVITQNILIFNCLI